MRRFRPQLEVLEDRTLLSVIGQNFTGNTLTEFQILNGFTSAPPDTMGAVGPDHFVEFTNGVFAIYSKSDGAVVGSKISDSDFWNATAGVTVTDGLSDPRILYDHASGRWIALEITTPLTGNEVLLARSDTSDPTGAWKGVSFIGNSGFADYPTLGLDADGVYIGTNNFTSSVGSFTGVSIFSIPKPDLLASTPSIANMTSFQNLDANTYGFTIQGAVNFGASDGHGALVAVDNVFFGRIDRTNVNNPGSAGASLSTTTTINVASTASPPQAQQPDGSQQIDALDDRLSGNVYEVGDLLYMVHTIGLSGRAAIRWTILNEASNGVVQEGTISNPNYDFFQPSIAANAYGDVVIGYNRSGSGLGDFISSFVSVGSTVAGSVTFDAPILLKTGEDNYHLFGGAGERWGDYSATTLDPRDPFTFWTVQEFPQSGDVWATQITQVTVVSRSQSTVSIAPSSIQSGSTATVTLTAKDASGNQLTSGGLTVTFGLGSGSSSGTFSTVTDNGNGTYTATLTGTTAGTARTITATINSQAVTSTLPTITVTPGPVSRSQSTISVAPSSIQSGSTATVKLTAKDANGNQLSSGGLTIAFGLGSGTSSGTFSSVTDNGNGTYTATFTGTTAGTARIITATINSQAVTSTLPTITVTLGSVSLSQSTVSVAPSSIQSGSTATVTLTAKDANGNQLSSGGLTVTFGLGSGSSSGTFSSVTDNGNGTYTATFTGTTAGTARTITATISGQAVTSTLPTITVTAGPVSLSQSTISVAPASIQLGSTATVTLTAKDASGNQLSGGGLSVAFGLGSGSSSGTFGSVTDNGNGTYTATFTGTTVGTARTITATINGQAVTSTLPTITVTAGPVSLSQSTISVAPASIQSGSTATVTLTARDASGNQLSGLSVAFGLGSGSSSGTFSSVTDNGDGTYTTTFTGTTAGTARTITATINGQAVTSTLPTITVTAGPVSLSQSTISVAPASIQSGSTATVTLTAKDANGNQLSGLSVAFGLGIGGSSGTYGSVTDNGNGTYTAIFTGTTAGTAKTITATIYGQYVNSSLPTITVTHGPVSLLQSTISVVPASIPLGGTATVTLTARDAGGNPLSSGGLSVAFGLGGGGSSGTFGSVTDNGNGTYTATFTGTTTGTARTITATINGQAVSSVLPSITVTAGPASLSQSTVSAAPASIQSGSTATVILTARDAVGTQLSGGGLAVAFGLGSGTSSGTFGSVTDNGNGTYTVTFTGATAGTARTITATINGQAVTSTLPTITVTPGPLSLSQSTVSAAPVSIQAGSTATVKLTARDAGGNPLSSAGLSVAFGLGSGSSNGTFSSVTDNGNGTYTATFTGTTAGTARTITATINGQAVTSTLPTITVTPGTATAVVFVQQPTNSLAGNNIAPAVTVQLRDQFNNHVSQPGKMVTMALASGNGTLLGTLSQVTNASGLANFGDLRIDLAGAKSLRASSSGLTSATTSSFNINAVADRVVFVQQPGNATAGDTINPVTVQLQDQFGNIISQSGVAVNMALISGSGTLLGTLTRITNAGGLATFDDLKMPSAGVKTLQASSGGLAAASSANFTIAAAAAKKIGFLKQPKSVRAGTTMPRVIVQLYDEFDNAVASRGVVVHLTLISGGLRQEYTAKTNALGQAVFRNLTLMRRGAAKLVARSDGFRAAVSRPFQVLLNPEFPWL